MTMALAPYVSSETMRDNTAEHHRQRMTVMHGCTARQHVLTGSGGCEVRLRSSGFMKHIEEASAKTGVGAKVYTGARWVLGLAFVVFGLNGFLNFIPVPPPAPEAGVFLKAMMETGYLLPLVKALEVVCGALLLANVFVPLALLVLAPIVVNILALHLMLDPAGLPLPVLLLVAGLVTARPHWSLFAPLLRAKA